MNCAAVQITGSGTSTLDDYPNMYVGEMNIPGQIATGECRSTAGTALLYPNPGPADRVTVTPVAGIPFKAPTAGKCYAPGGKAPQMSSPAAVAPTPVVVQNPNTATVVRSSSTIIPYVASTLTTMSTSRSSSYVVPISSPVTPYGAASMSPSTSCSSVDATPTYANTYYAFARGRKRQE